MSKLMTAAQKKIIETMRRAHPKFVHVSDNDLYTIYDTFCDTRPIRYMDSIENIMPELIEWAFTSPFNNITKQKQEISIVDELINKYKAIRAQVDESAEILQAFDLVVSYIATPEEKQQYTLRKKEL